MLLLFFAPRLIVLFFLNFAVYVFQVVLLVLRSCGPVPCLLHILLALDSALLQQQLMPLKLPPHLKMLPLDVLQFVVHRVVLDGAHCLRSEQGQVLFLHLAVEIGEVADLGGLVVALRQLLVQFALQIELNSVQIFGLQIQRLNFLVFCVVHGIEVVEFAVAGLAFNL